MTTWNRDYPDGWQNGPTGNTPITKDVMDNIENGIVTAHSEIDTHKASHDHDGIYYTETEADAKFLGITAKAADSDKLDGQHGTWYTPVGAVTAYAGSSAPAGWLECNGQSFSSSTYPQLYAVLGNSTAVPDLRGQFVRGWAHDGGTDAGRGIRTTQADAVGPHAHTIGASRFNGWPGSGQIVYDMWKNGSGAATDNNTGTTETRPKNVALMYIIKHD